MPHESQLKAATSALLVVDVQERLMVKIPGGPALVRNIAFLIDGARLLDVPVTATEQYPKGLGPTVADIAQRVPQRPEKTGFSCCAIPSVSQDFRSQGRSQIVVAGIEAHVCVLNTVLDLLADNFQVYLVVDALGSRYEIDRDVAIRRLERAGAIPTTCEGVLFEWLGGSQHPRFKAASALIQERMKSL